MDFEGGKKTADPFRKKRGSSRNKRERMQREISERWKKDSKRMKLAHPSENLFGRGMSDNNIPGEHWKEPKKSKSVRSSLTSFEKKGEEKRYSQNIWGGRENALS